MDAKTDHAGYIFLRNHARAGSENVTFIERLPEALSDPGKEPFFVENTF